MTPLSSALVMAAIGILLIALMVQSWVRQTRKAWAELPAIPQAQWKPLGEATYVSTVIAGQIFQRVAAHTLGERAKSQILISDLGVLIQREGAADLYISYDAYLGIRQGAGMVGKTVGGKGIHIIKWLHDGQELETGLRMRYHADGETLVALLNRKDLAV